MSNFLPKSIRNLIEEFNKLPGIGPKSAQRLAIHLLHSPASRITPLGEAVLGLKGGVMFCSRCWNIAESDPCAVCADSGRDQGLICVVENILDVVALEKTGEYKGTYHVLHGALSPIDGGGPEQLKVAELLERVGGRGESAGRDSGERVESNHVRSVARGATETDCGGGVDSDHAGSAPVREVILATNPSLEGEATALYIQKHLRDSGVKITRIARGLPVGADLEYADEITLTKALQGRGEF